MGRCRSCGRGTGSSEAVHAVVVVVQGRAVQQGSSTAVGHGGHDVLGFYFDVAEIAGRVIGHHIVDDGGRCTREKIVKGCDFEELGYSTGEYWGDNREGYAEAREHVD